MRRTYVEIRPSTVLMKRTSAHQGSADAAQLDAVARHELGDRMLASNSFGVDKRMAVGEARAAVAGGDHAAVRRYARG